MLHSWYNAYLLKYERFWVQSAVSCKPGMTLHACKHSTGEVGIREREIQGHPQLHSKYEAFLATGKSLITLKL